MRKLGSLVKTDGILKVLTAKEKRRFMQSKHREELNSRSLKLSLLGEDSLHKFECLTGIKVVDDLLVLVLVEHFQVENVIYQAK